MYDFYSPSSIQCKNTIFYIIENAIFPVTKSIISRYPFNVMEILFKYNRFKRIFKIWSQCKTLYDFNFLSFAHCKNTKFLTLEIFWKKSSSIPRGDRKLLKNLPKYFSDKILKTSQILVVLSSTNKWIISIFSQTYIYIYNFYSHNNNYLINLNWYNVEPCLHIYWLDRSNIYVYIVLHHFWNDLCCYCYYFPFNLARNENIFLCMYT